MTSPHSKLSSLSAWLVVRVVAAVVLTGSFSAASMAEGTDAIPALQPVKIAKPSYKAPPAPHRVGYGGGNSPEQHQILIQSAPARTSGDRIPAPRRVGLTTKFVEPELDSSKKGSQAWASSVKKFKIGPVTPRPEESGPYAEYMDKLQDQIRALWKPPKSSLKEGSIASVVAFKIAKDGTVSDIKLDRSCGNEVLDLYALNTIGRLKTAPPLPPGSEPSVSILFSFNRNVFSKKPPTVPVEKDYMEVSNLILMAQKFNEKGLNQDARSCFEKALNVLQSKKQYVDQSLVPELQCNIADTFSDEKKDEVDQAKLWYTRSLQSKPADDIAIRAENGLAHILYERDDYKNALIHYNKALKLTASHSTDAATDDDLAYSHHYVGNCLFNEDKYAEASKSYRNAVNILLKRKNEDARTAQYLYDLAETLYRCGKGKEQYAEARKFYQQSWDLRKKLLGPDSAKTIDSEKFVAWCYMFEEDYAAAIPLLEDVLRFRKAHSDKDDIVETTEQLASCYDEADNLPMALSYFRQLLKLQKDSKVSADKIRETEERISSIREEQKSGSRRPKPASAATPPANSTPVQKTEKDSAKQTGINPMYLVFVPLGIFLLVVLVMYIQFRRQAD